MYFEKAKERLVQYAKKLSCNQSLDTDRLKRIEEKLDNLERAYRYVQADLEDVKKVVETVTDDHGN
jgi:molecular chaperone GrpE (heat shock protein)